MALAKTAQSRRSRQKGFMMVATIIWLPLFLTIVVALSLVSFALLTRTKANTTCISGMLKLQKNLREKLLALEKLNPKAMRLRAQRTLSEKQLKLAIATGVLPAIAEAKAQLLLVISLQLQLRAQQQAILQAARLIRIQGRNGTRLELQRTGAALRPLPSANSESLAVVASPATSLSPNYDPLPNFRELQSESIQYQINIFREAPQWLLKNIRIDPWQKAQCGASLKGYPGHWALTGR